MMKLCGRERLNVTMSIFVTPDKGGTINSFVPSYHSFPSLYYSSICYSYVKQFLPFPLPRPCLDIPSPATIVVFIVLATPLLTLPPSLYLLLLLCN